MKVFDELEDYLLERKTPILNGFETIMKNGAFARFDSYNIFNNHLLQRHLMTLLWSEGFIQC